MMSKHKLTPTEDLIIEVLVARRRLGETLWTFDSRLSKQISSLEDKGLVDSMHGVIENTARVSFTDEGFAEYCSFDYEAPIAYDNPDLAEALSKVSQEAQKVKDQRGSEQG